MANGENANKHNKDWWGKRPLSGTGVRRNGGMKDWKRLLHKIERQRNKKEASKSLSEYLKDFSVFID